jgi:Cu+-exporting ATPase
MALVKSLSWGVAAFVLMLAVYFGVVSLVSGWDFTLEQFADFWHFIIALALGFGTQVGLYVHLRQLVGQQKMSGKVVAATGTTSTAAMVSCCAHYLVNVLPVLGVTGFVTLVAQYQVQLLWVGLAFNLAAILYIAPKVIKAAKEHKQCLINT